MSGDSETTQNQSEHSTSASDLTTSGATNTSGTTGPWGNTEPLLNSILGSLPTNTGVTSTQQMALDNLTKAAFSVPNYGSQASGVTSGLLNSTPQYNGMLTDAYDTYKGNMATYTDPSYLDPYSNPYLQPALDKAATDVTNSIAQSFAASGRDMSPAQSTAIASGITNAQTPLLLNQYNTNVGTATTAANNAYNAGNTTATNLTTQDQTAKGNQAAGVNMAATTLPTVYTAPGTTALNATNTSYALPYQNIGMLSGQVLPIAGLGTTTSNNTTTTGTSTGTGITDSTGTGTTTQSSDPWSNIIGGTLGGIGLLGGTGAFGSSGWLNPTTWSDARLKENIAPVGELYDGQPIYSYNYKGDDRPQIGLMAQDVEETHPEAVAEFGGYKAVDYGAATEDARAIGGMLSEMQFGA